MTANKEIEEKQIQMSFAAYYNSLKKLHVELRSKICSSLEISEKTFYNKFNGNSFSYPEKLVIASIVNKSVSELFPE